MSSYRDSENHVTVIGTKILNLVIPYCTEAKLQAGDAVYAITAALADVAASVLAGSIPIDRLDRVRIVTQGFVDTFNDSVEKIIAKRREEQGQREGDTTDESGCDWPTS